VAETLLPQPPAWVRAASRVIRSLPAGRYRAMNWVGRRPTPRFWAAMPPELGGLRYRCDLRDLLMREACLTGRYEPQETALFQRALAPGQTFVDVGANWGYFTLLASALVGEAGRVVAIEADPRACRTLAANIAHNALRRTTLVAAAASDVEGSLTLGTYGAGSDDSSNFGVTSTTTVAGDGRSFSVPARPLDGVLDEAGVDRVHLLKMDIEGAERRAFSGLERRLRAALIDRIVLELHPAHLVDQGSSAGEVVHMLRVHGFQLWTIEHSPDAHRRASSSTIESLLSPLPDTVGAPPGSWPHLLCARAGLAMLPSPMAAS
jgi:FkbM family methyltransferase